MRLLVILTLLLGLAACSGVPPMQDSAEFRAYAADLRTTALACGAEADELPVPTRIGHYTWNPQTAPFVVNGQRDQLAIAAAEECFWEGTKEHIR